VLAILGGIGAALSWTVTTVSAARGSRIVDSRSLLASVMTVGLVVAGPIAVIAGVPAALDAGSGAWLLTAGVANVAGLFLVYPAFRRGDLGVVAPLISTEGTVAAVIAEIAGERLGGDAIACLAAIAGGVLLATVTPTAHGARRHDLRATLLAAASAVAFGVSLYATGRAGATLGIPWAVLPPRLVGVGVIALPLALRRTWRIPRAVLPYAVGGGLCEVLGFASYAFGARHGLAVSAILASQFAALSAAVGFVFFRERLGRIQLVGLGTILCGVSTLAALQG
jgi:drug/metabolite transporter (DMT)-like permease